MNYCRFGWPLSFSSFYKETHIVVESTFLYNNTKIKQVNFQKLSSSQKSTRVIQSKPTIFNIQWYKYIAESPKVHNDIYFVSSLWANKK